LLRLARLLDQSADDSIRKLGDLVDRDGAAPIVVASPPKPVIKVLRKIVSDTRTKALCLLFPDNIVPLSNRDNDASLF